MEYPNRQGSRVDRSLNLAIAEMYVQGVSTRKVAAVMQEICGAEGGLPRIAPAKVEKFKAEVRLMTRRNQATSLREVTARLVPYMRGWANYFKLAAIRNLSQRLDEWIRRRLRCLRLKQCKHPKGIRHFLQSTGAKRKLWRVITGMGYISLQTLLSH